MQLNTEQQAAVEYLDGPLLVLAGPGTGKTQLLSAKVAYILENTDTNPENILCLTFTESGATNMRERLSSTIGLAAAKVNIFTYHAFGSNILERYKSYATDFDRRLDSAIDEVTQFQLLKNIQDQLPVRHILKKTEIKDLASTISSAKSARLSADDLAKIAEYNLQESSELSQQISPLLEALAPRTKFDIALAETYQPILEILSQRVSDQPIVGNIERPANLLTRELNRVITDATAAEKPSAKPLTAWRNQRFEKQDDGTYRLKDQVANKKLQGLAEVMRSYQTQLAETGLFDFADMIEEAIRALRTDRGFRLSLSEVFQFILLDEFQDTNPSQFELIKLLTDYENPVVMAVGDDDQAIFEFQGASASNLLDFQTYYKAKVITLLDNYRSTGAILDFSHRVAERVNDSFAKQHGVAKLLRSIRDTFAKPATPAVNTFSTPISRHEFTTAEQEYYWVTQQIAELIAAGESPDDIAIIAPKHKFIAPLLPYLKAANINIAYEKKSNLLEDPRLAELITLSEFIDDLAAGRNPEAHLLEVLAAPFLEVDAISAINAVQRSYANKQPALEYLAKADDTKLQQLARWFGDLAFASFETPLELMLDYLIGRAELKDFRSPYLDYYERTLQPAQLLEFYDGLSALRRVILEHQTSQPQLRLRDLVSTVNDYRAADAAVVLTSEFRDGEHAVQVMSAHKSKGLEFKYVFLIAVDNLAWGSAKGNNNKFSLPVNLQQIRHTGATDDERLRLLFVAITRAKSHLVMTNSVYNFDHKKVDLLTYLGEARDEKAPAQISPYLPEGQQVIIAHEPLDEATQLETTRLGWVANYQILTPELRSLLLKRIENYRLTASDLTSFIDVIYAGPTQVYRNRLLLAPSEPLTPELAYGTLIHNVFEQVTNQNIDDAAALELFQTASADLALSPREVEELREKGDYALPIALREFGKILRSPASDNESAQAEVNFSAEHLTLGDIPLTGKIDHLAINETDKTIEVYDFKTGNYHSSKWQSHPTLYKYALQLGFYKLLLNLSPTYHKYRVTKGHILFVSPDQDGKVYDKVYEYNESDEAELKRLMQAVYRSITSLALVEDPELNLPADKKHTLADVKAFVQLLLDKNPKTNSPK